MGRPYPQSQLHRQRVTLRDAQSLTLAECRQRIEEALAEVNQRRDRVAQALAALGAQRSATRQELGGQGLSAGDLGWAHRFQDGLMAQLGAYRVALAQAEERLQRAERDAELQRAALGEAQAELQVVERHRAEFGARDRRRLERVEEESAADAHRALSHRDKDGVP